LTHGASGGMLRLLSALAQSADRREP
jgi:hypothetical protein